jgi:hypothetical protein
VALFRLSFIAFNVIALNTVDVPDATADVPANIFAAVSAF